MTDDPIRSAFASFRADEHPRLAAPGVAAAHRTVRHRRRLVTGAAAGITTLLLLGTGYAVAASGTGAVPGPVRDQASTAAARDGAVGDGAATPSPDEPEGSGDGRGELSATTAAALGLDGTSHGVVFEVEPSGLFATDPAVSVLAATGGEDGPFRLRVACGGAGTLSITFRTSDDETTATARCGTTAEEIADGAGETSIAFGDEPFLEVSVDRGERVRTVAVELIPA